MTLYSMTLYFILLYFILNYLSRAGTCSQILTAKPIDFVPNKHLNRFMPL